MPSRAFNRLLLLITLCFAAGCTNLAVVEECVSEDWYERGYTDAADGHSTRQFLAHHNRCTQHGVTPHRTDYLSGWVAGRGLSNPS